MTLGRNASISRLQTEPAFRRRKCSAIAVIALVVEVAVKLVVAVMILTLNIYYIEPLTFPMILFGT